MCVAQVRHSAFIKAREKIKENLFRARSTFIKPLNEIANFAYTIDTTPFLVPLFKVIEIAGRIDEILG